MGARGPAKKPAKLHEQNGTFRSDRHGGPALAVCLPDAPPDLDPTAQAQWNIIGRKLVDAGLVAELDGTVLRVLAESMSLYLKASDEIANGGITIITDKGNLIQHPAVGIRNKQVAIILACARRFGMSPADRTGLNIESKQNDDDVAGILGLAARN